MPATNCTDRPSDLARSGFDSQSGRGPGDNVRKQLEAQSTTLLWHAEADHVPATSTVHCNIRYTSREVGAGGTRRQSFGRSEAASRAHSAR
eukprot:6362604-Prymnesium_polylepis.2